MNDVAYLDYSERIGVIDIMKLIFYTVVRCDGDVFDFKIVIIGPCESDDHDYDYQACQEQHGFKSIIINIDKREEE